MLTIAITALSEGQGKTTASLLLGRALLLLEEKEIMYWLAINREPVHFSLLRERFFSGEMEQTTR